MIRVLGLLIGSISTCCAFQLPTSSQRIAVPIRDVVTPLLAIKVEKTEAEWKEILRPEQYNVLRKEGTESPWTSPLNDVKEDGTFRCAGCASPIFTTATKFESGSGWPSFYDPIDSEAVDLSVDYKLIIPRTEVTCKSCGGHLGHVFDDGPKPTGKRYCLNGVAMDFILDTEDPDLAKSVMERNTGGGRINMPLMSILPGVALDAAVAVLFISSFISKNGSDGLALFSDGGFEIGQVLKLAPLAVGAYYAVRASQKIANFASSSE
mmetsp:Transcript_24112/g.27907  ORF Transcript_24112/g.27907 Transcript_24112/m.27907 type:complete len:265 (+) Transcript_24112:344-1138(+)